MTQEEFKFNVYISERILHTAYIIDTKSLTTAVGSSILESGFFHADAHAGNIFVLDDGRIGLIDFSQVKQVNSDFREARNSAEGL